MLTYSLVLAKLALGLLCLVLQINLLGKGNLAPSSATDQVQNYVLGGIIGGVIYNENISVLDFILVLIAWTMLVLLLKYMKSNSSAVKSFVDGHPVRIHRARQARRRRVHEAGTLGARHPSEAAHGGRLLRQGRQACRS